MTVLYPGAWSAFTGGGRGGFIPEELSEKIFQFLWNEQLQEIGDEVKDQYITGFAKEKSGSVRGRRRDILEQEETRVHKSNCHPGRFSLNPDAGVRAVEGDPALLCGGYAPRREFSARKHRKLIPDVSSIPQPTRLRAVRLSRRGGFLGVYFLGGLPLAFWSSGDDMGLKFNLPSNPGIGVLRSDTEDDIRYRLTDGLLVFGEEQLPGFLEFLGSKDAAGYLMRQEQSLMG